MNETTRTGGAESEKTKTTEKSQTRSANAQKNTDEKWLYSENCAQTPETKKNAINSAHSVSIVCALVSSQKAVKFYWA